MNEWVGAERMNEEQNARWMRISHFQSNSLEHSIVLAFCWYTLSTEFNISELG